MTLLRTWLYARAAPSHPRPHHVDLHPGRAVRCRSPGRFCAPPHTPSLERCLLPSLSLPPLLSPALSRSNAAHSRDVRSLQAHPDADTRCTYYFNPLTGKSVWEPPAQTETTANTADGQTSPLAAARDSEEGSLCRTCGRYHTRQPHRTMASVGKSETY